MRLLCSRRNVLKYSLSYSPLGEENSLLTAYIVLKYGRGSNVTLLDLVLISFSTYFIFSVLAEYSIPDILRKSRLTICIISGINVILVNSFSNLDLIYFSLAAAGIACFIRIIKSEKILPVNVKDNLKQVLNNDNDLRQTQLIDQAKQENSALKTVNNAVKTGRTEQPVKRIQQTTNVQYPIVTKIITMKAPVTFNEFYKDAADSKMLLSDELLKKLYAKK